jgi:predicted metalloprotease with PDZ domain
VRIFLGKGGDTGPLILPYDLSEVIADLNQVAPYDWAKFIHDRIEEINPRADLSGIERGGYRLIYADKPTKGESTEAASGSPRGNPIDVWYSIGIRVAKDGTIMDVRWGGPADKAKLTPGQKIYAVNGVVFTGDGLKAAVREAKGKTEPIHLILQSDTFVSLADLDYHDGERYPALERVEGMPDYLDEITRPLVGPPNAGAPPAK